MESLLYLRNMLLSLPSGFSLHLIIFLKITIKWLICIDCTWEALVLYNMVSTLVKSSLLGRIHAPSRNVLFSHTFLTNRNTQLMIFYPCWNVLILTNSLGPPKVPVFFCDLSLFWTLPFLKYSWSLLSLIQMIIYCSETFVNSSRVFLLQPNDKLQKTIYKLAALCFNFPQRVSKPSFRRVSKKTWLESFSV